MTSSTEVLRRLLDERGVDWWAEDDTSDPAYYFVTKWFANGIEQTYEEIPAIRSRSLKGYCITPEQAIAATLGAEPDDATMVRMHDKMNTALIKYEQAQGIERREGDGKDVVPFVAEMHRLLDEAATLGNDGVGRTNDGVVERGTCDVDCTVKWDWDCCETYWEHELSCGHTVTTMEPEPPNFCQDCGAEVVK